MTLSVTRFVLLFSALLSLGAPAASAEALSRFTTNLSGMFPEELIPPPGPWTMLPPWLRRDYPTRVGCQGVCPAPQLWWHESGNSLKVGSQGAKPAVLPSNSERPSGAQENLDCQFSFSAPYPALSPGLHGPQANPAYYEARGPIPIRNSRPFNLLFLQFMPETSDLIAPGTNRYGVQLDLINNLLIPDPNRGATVVDDNEYQRLTLSWRHGLNRRLELGVYLPVEWRDGGFLDSILDTYHRLLGVAASLEDDPKGRNFYPNYRSILEVIDSNGQVKIRQGNAFGLGETNVTLKRSLIPATPHASAAIRLGVKLPTGNPDLLLGSGSPDIGLSLDGRYTLRRRVIVYLNIAGVLTGNASDVPGAQRGIAQSFLGVEFRANNRDSYHFQMDANSLAVRTGNHFADAGDVTATFGYHRVVSRHVVLRFSYTENGDVHNYHLPFLSNIGPDITLSGGMQWRP